MTLDGLKSRLEKSTVAPGSFALAYTKKALGPVDDCLCLYDDGKNWVISFVERGQWNEVARFGSFYDAGRFFWWRLTGARSPFDEIGLEQTNGRL
jgi:hypothetical protein